MELKRCSHYSDYSVLNELLFCYINELHSIDNTVVLRTKGQLAREYFYTADTSFFLVYEGSTAIGFCILGFDGNCHPDVNVYIEEFYIVPEARRHGYGTAVFEELIIKNNMDTVCFYVLNNNSSAATFWRNLFAKNSWDDISDMVHDINNNVNNCDWHVYRRKY